ncbi:tyrosyl-DNA phosphodiesterase 2 isoform X2 [Esox lucius]|uniref:tyrosyl-DNA phosphodiesterase 2 isoform X2 n=1 Tax=Esox lucius TaxID=8010 RepID=UPI0014777FA1|nr:tyrosyl-DNA phosphodiesterase 2 isoform X2 [Esox lucius]
MEHKQKNIVVRSSLDQPQPKESDVAQSVQPETPPLQQFDQGKHLPEQTTILKQPAKCNPPQPPVGTQHPVTLPSELSSQAQPEQPNLMHPYLAQPPIDDPHLTQSKDQPHPDQGSPVSLSLDQSSQQKTSPDQSSLSSPDEDKPKNKGDPNKLSLLTWNIDGLDMDDIKERCSKLLDYIIKYHPDIVLLQEVISPTYQVLQQVLKPYHVLPGSDKSYFTAILLRKSRVQLLGSSIVNYPNTKMRRNLLVANVNNLGGLPEGICDIWESLGQPQDCRYTWDCITNDNKELPFPARLRFDRLFLRQAGEGSKVSPDGLTLVGLERLECDRFISDHWGLLCTFVIEPLSQLTPKS